MKKRFLPSLVLLFALPISLSGKEVPVDCQVFPAYSVTTAKNTVPNDFRFASVPATEVRSVLETLPLESEQTEETCESERCVDLTMLETKTTVDVSTEHDAVVVEIRAFLEEGNLSKAIGVLNETYQAKPLPLDLTNYQNMKNIRQVYLTNEDVWSHDQFEITPDAATWLLMLLGIPVATRIGLF